MMATLLTGAAVVTGTPRASAADDLDPRGFTTIGRVAASGRSSHEPFAIGAASGYGYTESVLSGSDAHHRLAGAVAARLLPVRWLGVGLRLDGRYDSHTLPDGEGDSGWVGDPRIFLHADHALGGGASAGLRATIWMPGDEAPSIKVSAATTDLVATFSYAPGGPVSFHANAGYRIDNSAASAPLAGRLMPSDRLSLGVSDFNAALVGLGATYGGPRYHVFGEWTWDVLVGSGAPSAMVSPMRIGVGARARLTSLLAFEGLAEISPSSRPSQAVDAPLVPVPPRFVALAGLVARWGASKPLAPIEAPTPAITEDKPDKAVAKPLATATLEARLQTGGALPPDAKVTIRTASGEQQVTPDATGRLYATDLPVGPAEITATAEGYEPAHSRVVLAPGTPIQIDLQLKPRLPPGQIRGTVRSFGGKGLTALVSVNLVEGAGPGGAAPAAVATPIEVRAEGGQFQIDVQPGTYKVTIRAQDFETQTRSVRVEQNGVTVLNVDLRKTQ